MDLFEETRFMFHIPDGIIYLDGNSLGPLPRAALRRVQQTMQDEWGEQLISAWNLAGWMNQPRKLGDRIGRLIGAPADSIVVGDTLSIKVYQALSSALELRPDRKIILSDSGNFPTDLYMAEGLVQSLKRDYVLKVVEPEDVASHINETVAVLMLTHVDYRTGRMHDMKTLTDQAHRAGAVTIWDLAHSAGAVEVDLATCRTEFAAGCTYKYLNAGPGAPAFIYIRPDLQSEARPALAGWLGHDEPFAFEPSYRPAQGIERMRVGTPPIIQFAALETALDIWDRVNMSDIRQKSVELSEIFIKEVEQRCPQLTLASPRESAIRGSQVSFSYENGYAAMQALIAKGVIGDFRAPDIMRFGFTPLYINSEDVIKAAGILEDILKHKIWNQAEYKKKSAVT